MPPYSVVALYVFARIDDPAAARRQLLDLAGAGGLCGTLLVAPEGFNGTLAAESRAALAAFVGAVAMLAGVAVDGDGGSGVSAGDADSPRGNGQAPATAHRRLELKWSTASSKPFQRLKIRLKPEIVTLRQPQVDLSDHVGAYVDPADWNALISDPDTILIDTRNAYEVEIGTFVGAVDPGTREFRQFPAWVEANRQRLQGKRIATFCTGGIRCEKATAYLQDAGFTDVHHLKGGILRYLEEVPVDASLWQGACFVFDERVALGPGLIETGHRVCPSCQRAHLGHDCPRCGPEPEGRVRESLRAD